MNPFLVKAMLNHYSKAPPDDSEVDRLYEQYKGQLSGMRPEQLEALKPTYPTLVPAIDRIKSRIAQTLVPK